MLLTPATVGAVGTGSIEGAVTGPGAAPLSEVWACAYLMQAEEFEEDCDFTSADGLYSITGLEAGEYRVEFWPESTSPSYVGEFYDDRRFWEEADEVEVKEGAATTGIDAELAEAATIEGEIRASSLGGPVESAVACAHLPVGGVEGCALVRKDGTYTLSGLFAGEYKVQFVPAAFRYNLLNQFYDHKSSAAEADLLEVAAGETKTGIDADLEAGAEIRGTVYSAVSGSPLVWTMVCGLFMEKAAGEWLPKECVRTSSTGSYKLIALPAESYKVVFSSELKEFFGEGSFWDNDGYLKQYFDRKPTLDAADSLALTPPEVRTGIDGHLQPESTVPPSLAPAVLPAVGRPAPRRPGKKRCRPGFRKKKIAGKRRCVKTRKQRRRGRGKGSASTAPSAAEYR